MSIKNFNTTLKNNFDCRPAKEFLENYNYTYIGSKMISSVFAITGQAINRHILNAVKVASSDKSKIYFMDIEPRIYEIMLKRKQQSTLDTNKVKIGLGNFISYDTVFKLNRPCRVMDLDLCQTPRDSKYLIANILSKQSISYNKKYNNLYKCLMFTTTLRGYGMKKNLIALNLILDVIESKIDIEKTLNQKRKNIFKYVNELKPVLLKRNRIHELKIFSYRDGAPMMSCVILYK